MSIRINQKWIANVLVLEVSGRITLGEGASTFRDELRKVLRRGNKRVLVDLGEVTYVDDSGIGELVCGFTIATNLGGQLKLLNLTKRVHDLLQITKLYTVFEVYDDKAEAVRSFS